MTLSKLKLISKEQANDVLSRRKRAPRRGGGGGGRGGGGGSQPPKTGRRYYDVGQECILKECSVNDLFKQNIYSNEEYETTKLEEDRETNGEGVRLAWSGEFAYEAFDDEVYEEDGESEFILGENRWEHFNPCFLGYNGGYSEEIDTKRKVACWPSWKKVDEEDEAEGVECNFPPVAEDDFKQEMMTEFSTFKDYFWPQLTSEEGSVMREGYKGLRSALYNDICAFTPIYLNEDSEEVSEMSELKLTFSRNREKAQDIFGKLYPDEFPVTPRERGVVIEMNRTWWKENGTKLGWGLGGSIFGVCLCFCIFMSARK